MLSPHFTYTGSMYLVVLLYALFGSVFTIAKIGLAETQPLFFVGSRMFIAGILMLFYQWSVNPAAMRIRKEHLWLFFQLALFNIYLTNAFEFWGLQYLTSFKTCFIYSLCPFISALLSYIVFNERMTKIKWVGMAIGFLGFIPILLAEGQDEAALGHLFFLSWAELAVMCAAASSVYGWVLLRQLVRDGGYSPTYANGIAMFLGGLFALFHSAMTETWDPIPVNRLDIFLKSAFALIIISNFFCYNLYGYLLKKYTATFLSFAGWMTPLFAALSGWYFLGEQVPAAFFVSAAIVLIGLSLFYKEELRQGYFLCTD